ncbi:hypothetical protein U879_03670 [Defluviimonas sp. 20V17]|nr:hypothetical protein U879_03670 [Defluviimonas sp. 20V17]
MAAHFDPRGDRQLVASRRHRPIEGHEFVMQMDRWGAIPCRVTEVAPGRPLPFTFGDFDLRWTITPTAEGCVLRPEHHGFDLSNPKHRFAFDNMGPG